MQFICTMVFLYMFEKFDLLYFGMKRQIANADLSRSDLVRLL